MRAVSAAKNVITRAAYYHENECVGWLRRSVRGTVDDYLRRSGHRTFRSRNVGDVPRPIDIPADTRRQMEDALRVLFRDGLLTIEEFRSSDQDWLEGFVHTKDSPRASAIRRCQELNSAARSRR